MKTSTKYRKDAERCRELLDHPVEPELRIQLRLWAAELEDIANAIERGGEEAARKEFARPLLRPVVALPKTILDFSTSATPGIDELQTVAVYIDYKSPYAYLGEGPRL
jgi:hypothetical protein